jgi:hypothetical protein
MGKPQQVTHCSPFPSLERRAGVSYSPVTRFSSLAKLHRALAQLDSQVPSGRQYDSEEKYRRHGASTEPSGGTRGQRGGMDSGLQFELSKTGIMAEQSSLVGWHLSGDSGDLNLDESGDQ